jgi:ABC-type taurine transport system substrate-binding protein
VWRLTAWVKGRDVAPGDISWQVPVIRFAVLTDKMTYVSSPPVKGTFDWRKVEVELTIPPALSSLVVQLGQNGSSGTLWIDDVKLERIDHQ